MHQTALDHKIRIIAFDRPGLGKSPFQKLTNVHSEAGLVEALANRLQLKKFSIIGLSGGGATALATAFHMPKRLHFCASMVGWAPVHDNPQLHQHLAPADRLFLRLARYMPWLFRFGCAYLGHHLQRDKESILKLIAGSLSATDKEALNTAEFSDFFLEDLRLAFAQGAKGPAQDAYLRYQPWGFELSDIACPVHLYAAEQDKFVPLAFVQTLHTQIPESKLYIFEQAGHLTAIQHFDQVAKDLSAMHARK
ncbi:alpha/beta fold hydrolase [Maritalea mediterranea]|uniref:Alpha/beta hydrolase n=1 Tax=Maritalea mediterranea TaxID=2909667 RepID=A0ABS9E7L8_9HYPH|nr:alpha/beta hydrolase [Maritalea mediterranea]MCF4098788.1 alpha/beta hydrolase [Maritalea mediterranea]